MGCARGQTTGELEALRDSLHNVFFKGYVRNDTAMLKRALELSGYLLSVDSTVVGKRECYHYRAVIFSSLGRMDEAMANAERAVLTLPEKNPSRLLFFATKNLKQGDGAVANRYIKETIVVCDSALHVAFNEDMVVTKVKAILLRDGEQEAKRYLTKQLREHPHSSVLRALSDEWEEWIRMNKEEMEMLSIEFVR